MPTVWARRPQDMAWPDPAWEDLAALQELQALLDPLDQGSRVDLACLPLAPHRALGTMALKVATWGPRVLLVRVLRPLLQEQMAMGTAPGQLLRR